MKKIFSYLLSLVLIMSCLSVGASAVSSISISGATYPTTIVKGDTFSVYGTVSSGNSITSITVGVYKSDGTAAFSYTGKPCLTTYNLHDADYLMTFSKLDVGTYYYKVIASDTVQSKVILINKQFKVIANASGTSLLLTSENYPSHIINGDSFSVKGIINSESNIKSVTACVINSSGTVQFSKTITPGTRTYSLNSLDAYMTFSKLTPGVYTYRVMASNASYSDIVLLSKSFAVSSESTNDAQLEEKEMNFIDLSVWNTVNSWSSVAKSVDGVILRIGYRGTMNKVINPDTTFNDNYINAKAQNLHVGCYFFSAAVTKAEAIEEAKFVMSKLEKDGCKLDMPIYFDMETDDQRALTRQQATDVAKAFCDEIAENGYYAGVYCNTSWAQNEIYASQLDEYTLWIAHYNSYCSFTGSYGMWQNSDTGTHPGISDYVDTNTCYYDYPSYIIANGLNGYEKRSANKLEVKKSSGAVVDGDKKIISNIGAGLTANQFKDKYITASAGTTVTVSKTFNNLVGTNTIVQSKVDNKVLDTYTVSVSGDTDSNAIINSTDALVVLQNVVGLKSLESVEKLSADYNLDGSINSADALLVLKAVISK